MARDHIHTRDDGRGRRDVYLNGVKVTGVFWADTRRGKLRRYVVPYRIDKRGKRLLSRTDRGRIEIIKVADDGA